MRQTGRACLRATVVLIGLAGVSRGQSPGSSPPLAPQQSPAQDGSGLSFGYSYSWSYTYSDGKPGQVSRTPTPPTPRSNEIVVPYWYFPTAPLPFSPYSVEAYQNSGRAAPRRRSDPEVRQRVALVRSRELTPQSLAKIELLISDGDQRFRRQNYSLAADRYRAAAQKGSADAFLRHGFALIAQGNYKSAAIAFQNAQALRPDWTDAQFSLDQIYAPGVLEKTTERLSRKLATNPGQEGLLTSMCMQLYFSGNLEQARLYATRASGLGGADATLAESFLSGRKKF